MKKTYSSPVIYVEHFAASEYIAACETIVTLGENGNTYTLKLGGGMPAVGDGVGGTFEEDPSSGFTAYNCGGGEWVVMGAIVKNHSYSDPAEYINGEYDFAGANGHTECTDPVHRSLLDAHNSPYTLHHHLNQVTVRNAS